MPTEGRLLAICHPSMGLGDVGKCQRSRVGTRQAHQGDWDGWRRQAGLFDTDFHAIAAKSRYPKFDYLTSLIDIDGF